MEYFVIYYYPSDSTDANTGMPVDAMDCPVSIGITNRLKTSDMGSAFYAPDSIPTMLDENMNPADRRVGMFAGISGEHAYTTFNAVRLDPAVDGDQYGTCRKVVYLTEADGSKADLSDVADDGLVIYIPGFRPDEAYVNHNEGAFLLCTDDPENRKAYGTVQINYAQKTPFNTIREYSLCSFSVCGSERRHEGNDYGFPEAIFTHEHAEMFASEWNSSMAGLQHWPYEEDLEEEEPDTSDGLVVRFYPADALERYSNEPGDFNIITAEEMWGAFGFSTWLKNYDLHDHDSPTLIIPGSESYADEVYYNQETGVSLSANLVSWWGELGNRRYYEDRVFITHEGGEKRSVTLADLPVEVFISGLNYIYREEGASPPDFHIPNGNYFKSTSYTNRYSAGVFEVGIWEAGEYMALLSFRFCGDGVEPLPDGASWILEGVPQPKGEIWTNEEGFVKAILSWGESLFSGFWTDFKKTEEIV